MRHDGLSEYDPVRGLSEYVPGLHKAHFPEAGSKAFVSDKTYPSGQILFPSAKMVCTSTERIINWFDV